MPTLPVLDLASGIVTMPAGTPSGSYTITFQICVTGKASVCATSDGDIGCRR
ncbi:MAG: hypothetical protein RSG22_05675 [Comamonas sp.]